jgi:phosphoglycolate phosphatase-like HAD superfamily hydrolase
VYGEDARRRKPHPDALLLGLERLAVSAARAAYVGDSPEDVEMARAAGVYAVGIPGGFPNRDALSASAPDLLAADLEEAVTTLLSLALSGS